MTILDQITREVSTLPTKKRQQALQMIRSLRTPARTRRKNTTSTAISKSPVDRRKLHPALRAIAGMWKDRTDLPEDSVAASKILRRRVMGRSTHA